MNERKKQIQFAVEKFTSLVRDFDGDFEEAKKISLIIMKYLSMIYVLPDE